MMKNKIFNSVMILICLFALAGCVAVTETSPQTNEEEPLIYKQDMMTQALEHAQQMQLAAMKAQDENAILRARNEELMEQIMALQEGSDLEQPEPVPMEPIDPDNLEQEYMKIQKENEELRKLVKYERGLREELMRRIDQDQATIKELQSKLEE